jgi:hypothetical protein
VKLTREQLLQQNLKVFLQKPHQTRPYQVVFPENVDTETGTVELWVIPTDSKEDLLKVEPLTPERMTHKPDEIDGFAILKTDHGKITILNADNQIVIESS